MLKKLFRLLFGISNSSEITTPTPTPIQNLKRVKANVKVTWIPSTTVGIVSQRIIVVARDTKLIEKDLDPITAAFSFSAMRDTEIILTIMPFNGIEYGDPTQIKFIV